MDAAWLDAVLEAGHAVEPGPFEVRGNQCNNVGLFSDIYPW